jgi:hypothetical protein
MDQYRELAATIADQAQAIADGTVVGPLHGAVARLKSNLDTLVAWTPDDRQDRQNRSEAMKAEAVAAFYKDTTEHAHTDAPPDYNRTANAVRAYAEADCTSYTHAYSAVMKAYRRQYGAAQFSTDVERMNRDGISVPLFKKG